ncbi:MAG: hypothetical protein KDK89_01990 [Alphaproteobacteria bacterium]|nr:hypothetical protein [Alphaproteobacteria bacterium]
MKYLRTLILSKQAASWADQIVVSGANLVMLLALARWATVADVGYYAVAFSLLALAITVQDSLVTRPFTIQMFKLEVSAETHAAASLALALLLIAVLSISVLLVAAGLVISGASGTVAGLAAMLAAAMPPVLLREFARRYGFALLEPRQALATDLVAAILSMCCVGLLGLSGQLTAITAMAALAVGCGVSVAGWLICLRRNFEFDLEASRLNARASIRFGKWLLSGQIALQAQGYAAHWITLAIGGAAATGLYSACLSIVALSNPFLFGYFNILTPKFVRVLKDHGASALRRQASHDSLIIGAMIGTFVLFVGLLGSQIMDMMFPGEAYRAGIEVLNLLAIATLLGAIGGPAGVALMAAERGRPLAVLSAAICALGSALIILLMWFGGLKAAAVGIVLTEALGTLGRWAMLFYFIPADQTATASRSPSSAVT